MNIICTAGDGGGMELDMESKKYYLAIDIGASGGRHMIGYMENNKLQLEEAYRFSNHYKEDGAHLVWDIENLFEEILNGMAACHKSGKDPISVGIDTWGVDYVLLDKNMREILPAFSYRDRRGSDSMDGVENCIGFSELYRFTGAQRQPFNTIYQLYWDKQNGRLDEAEYLLMLPDYFYWKLTGEISQEYTHVTTTGMVNVLTNTWDDIIINTLKYPQKLFKPLVKPGHFTGSLSPNISQKVGFNCSAIRVCTHDTASAITACPSPDKNQLYISSGTWSLMGIESERILNSEECMRANFTSIGGAEDKYYFLKNIAGLWLIQQIKREYKNQYTYTQLMEMAQTSRFVDTVNVQDDAFFSPENMTEAIRGYLQIPDLPLNDVLNCVYHSLAKLYAETVQEIEIITGEVYDSIYIFGGGCQNTYLNKLTKQYSGKQVFTEPVEATAIGNLIVQLIADGVIKSVNEGRALVRDSFGVGLV